jgi:hypothetical protein
LAKKAKLAQTTITRFLRPEAPFALNVHTIAKIEDASGVAFQGSGAEPTARTHEAIPFSEDSDEMTRIREIGRTIAIHSNGLAKWSLRSRALETAGYMPGDILVVDLNLQQQPGDVVCAQLYDWPRGSAHTVFRKWEPPYLVSATFDQSALAPIYVDNRNVMIKGVVVMSLRTRQARAAA